MVTPAVRREAVAHLQVAYEVSERRACAALGADRPIRGVNTSDDPPSRENFAQVIISSFPTQSPRKRTSLGRARGRGEAHELGQ
jgi:hypothetical protein